MTKSELIQHLHALQQLRKTEVTVNVDNLLKILEQTPAPADIQRKSPRTFRLDSGVFGDHLE